MNDPYAWWRWAVEGRKGDPPDLVRTVYDADTFDNPQLGYYRTRMQRGAPYVPAAIWLDEGRPLCRVGFDDLWQMINPADRWLFMEPVSYEAYLAASRTHIWPDQPETDLGPIQQEIIAADDGGALVTLRDRVENARKRDKAPHLEAGRQVDARYQSVFDLIEQRIAELKEKEAA